MRAPATASGEGSAVTVVARSTPSRPRAAKRRAPSAAANTTSGSGTPTRPRMPSIERKSAASATSTFELDRLAAVEVHVDALGQRRLVLERAVEADLER